MLSGTVERPSFPFPMKLCTEQLKPKGCLRGYTLGHTEDPDPGLDFWTRKLLSRGHSHHSRSLQPIVYFRALMRVVFHASIFLRRTLVCCCSPRRGPPIFAPDVRDDRVGSASQDPEYLYVCIQSPEWTRTRTFRTTSPSIHKISDSDDPGGWVPFSFVRKCES